MIRRASATSDDSPHGAERCAPAERKAVARLGSRRGVTLTGLIGARVFALALVLLLTLTLTPTRAMAQTGRVEPGTSVVVVQQIGLAEAAMASCAGGAMIGYLLVVATGPGSPTANAALFCGLSAAATVTSSVTFWAWRSVTGWLP